MTQESSDAGMIAVLMERLIKQRLPTALDLKKKVDKGGRLNEFDIVFLQEVMANASKVEGLLERHPEYKDLVIKLISLYHQITEKALENEKKA